MCWPSVERVAEGRARFGWVKIRRIINVQPTRHDAPHMVPLQNYLYRQNQITDDPDFIFRVYFEIGYDHGY